MNWPLVKLTDCCEIIMGQAPVGSSYNDKGEGYSLIAGAGDFGMFSPKPKKHTTAASKLSKKDDLILCIRATIGDLNWSDQEYCLGRGVAGLRPKATLDKDYLWFFIKANKEQLSSKGTGSTFKQVSRAIISDWEIPLPPLPEQKRIAAILDKADAIRRKRQQAIQLADDFLRAVFLDMFGDPVTNPKGWEVKKVEYFCEVQGGLQVSKKRFGLPIKAPYLRVANVLRNRLNLKEIKQIELTKSEYSRVVLEVDDLLVVEGHGNENEIGRCAIWNGEVDGIVHQNHLIRIRVKTKSIKARFLNDYINSSGGRTQMIKASNTTSGLHTISTGIVKSTVIICPPVALQEKYIATVELVLKNLRSQKLALGNIDETFNSLSQLAFRDKL